MHALAGSFPVELAFKLPFDATAPGVLAQLASTRGANFPNPHAAGLVEATWSSEGSGPVSLFVQHQHAAPVQAHTSNAANSWMCVDLRRPVLLRHYCLRHDKQGGSYVLRNWVLQGSPSAAGEDWTVLRQHVGDNTLPAQSMAVASWPVDSKGSFRRFRILQTGPNSNGNNYLMCSGIELYGVLL